MGAAMGVPYGVPIDPSRPIQKVVPITTSIPADSKELTILKSKQPEMQPKDGTKPDLGNHSGYQSLEMKLDSVEGVYISQDARKTKKKEKHFEVHKLEKNEKHYRQLLKIEMKDQDFKWMMCGTKEVKLSCENIQPVGVKEPSSFEVAKQGQFHAIKLKEQDAESQISQISIGDPASSSQTSSVKVQYMTSSSCFSCWRRSSNKEETLEIRDGAGKRKGEVRISKDSIKIEFGTGMKWKEKLEVIVMSMGMIY